MLNKIHSTLKEQSNFDKLIYLIIFMLPLFAISIRHWVSSIFPLLFVLSLAYYLIYKKDARPLAKEEKYYIYIFLFYFVVFLLSSIVNGWGEPQTHILGTMLHFIAIIPIFYMFRKLYFLLPVLIAGSILASFFNVIYIYNISTKGVYGHLFSGPMTFLFSSFIIYALLHYRLNIIIKIILITGFILSILTIFELGSRSAIMALFMITVFYLITIVKVKARIYVIFSIILLSVVSYYANDNVKMRADRISHGISVYINEENPEQATDKFNTVHDIAARFEMWRAGKFFIAEDPVFGFGPNEFENEIKILVDKNLINSVAIASHPHNAYLLELFSKGLIGLLAMILVLYYPAYVFIVRIKSNPNVSIIGLSVIISITAFSLTESAAFNNNNFSSIMLIYISVVFVSLFQTNSILNEKNEILQ